jgi:hypothetical protein
MSACLLACVHGMGLGGHTYCCAVDRLHESSSPVARQKRRRERGLDPRPIDCYVMQHAVLPCDTKRDQAEVCMDWDLS